MRRVMLAVWFGPLPPWMDRYMALTVEQGIDWVVFTDLEEFRRRVRAKLGVSCPIEPGDAKIHDYRPAFAVLFEKELAGYDFWGHTDLDCVYGRLDNFYGEDVLAGLDVISDHWDYLCGPWSLYRNIPEIADLFATHEGWRHILEDPQVHGWVETSFTELLNETGLRIVYQVRHAWTQPELLRLDERMRLLWGEVEVPFFHFRRSKVWPEVLA